MILDAKSIPLTSGSPDSQDEDTILVQANETMKHGIVHFLQKCLFNPPIEFVFAIRLIPRKVTTHTLGCLKQSRRHTNSLLLIVRVFYATK
jgi:hypothetical protein